MTTSTNGSPETVQTDDEFRVSRPWTTRAKIGGVLLGVIVILVLMVLALVNFPQSKPTTSGSVAPKATTKPAAARTTVPVTMVSALDFTTCKTIKKVLLSDGNVRIIGSGCDPIQGPSAQTAVTAPETEQASRPTAAAKIRNAASTPPATEEVPTSDQVETAVVVEMVTEMTLEELRGMNDAPPEGAIDADEFDRTITGTGGEAP